MSHVQNKKTFFFSKITKPDHKFSKTFYFIKISYVLAELLFFCFVWCLFAKKCHFYFYSYIKLHADSRLNFLTMRTFFISSHNSCVIKIRVFILGKIISNFTLSDAEDSTSGPFNRGGIADLSLLRSCWEHYLAIHQKSQEPNFWKVIWTVLFEINSSNQIESNEFIHLHDFTNFGKY